MKHALYLLVVLLSGVVKADFDYIDDSQLQESCSILAQGKDADRGMLCRGLIDGIVRGHAAIVQLVGMRNGIMREQELPYLFCIPNQTDIHELAVELKTFLKKKYASDNIIPFDRKDGARTAMAAFAERYPCLSR